ncbi:MAG: nickel/cobalt transporter (NicO) family protein [Micromonosporaceae bacterium]
MRKILGIGAAVAAGLMVALATPAHPASAHPLGNFSVNQLAALDLYRDRVQVTAIVDIAELPTLQERSTVDTDRDGTASDAERAGFAATTCAALAAHFALSIDGHRLEWTVGDTGFRYAPGSAGLQTSRLDCALRSAAPLGAPATVDVANGFRSDRIGWRELTAAGHGVTLVDPPVPARSISNGLTAYPRDLLSSPLSERSAQLRVRPGAGVPAAAAAPATAAPVSFTVRWTAGAESALRQMVGSRHLGPLVGLLAVLLALVLGAAHAALPGHGKTVMAAYLAGRAGRPRDALVVGATVTLTHTGGVLLLGLLLTTVAGVAGETVLGWLGVVSGALVATVGIAMLTGALRRRGRPAQHRHPHHGRSHEHHIHSHGPDEAHDHDHHGLGDAHGHDQERAKPGRLATVGMGIAGGLVPSPSALIILLGAIGLGRTAFGVLLVLGYGLGMAATLTAAGFALIRLRDRLAQRQGVAHRLAGRLSAVLPTGTAAVVLLVGIGLAGRALATL